MRLFGLAFTLVLGSTGILLAEAAPPTTGPATQPADAKALVEQLGDADFKVRELAGERLVQLGDSALPALREATRSDDPEVRARAESLINRIENPPPPVIVREAERRGGMPGGVRVMVSSVNGERTVNVAEGDNRYRIQTRQDGSILVLITRPAGDDKEITREYTAKDAAELEKNHPEAHEVYRRYGAGWAIRNGGGGAILLDGNARARLNVGPRAIEPRADLIQRLEKRLAELERRENVDPRLIEMNRQILERQRQLLERLEKDDFDEFFRDMMEQQRPEPLPSEPRRMPEETNPAK